MKKSVIALSVLASTFISHVFAGDGAGTVNFSGEVTTVPCDVSVNGSNGSGTVELEKIAKHHFQQKGHTAGDKNFTVAISNCPETVSRALIKFNGAQHEQDLDTLSHTGTAEGVGIALHHKDGEDKQILLSSGGQSNPIDVTGGSATFNFAAKYKAVAAKEAIKPGNVNAIVNFTVDMP